MLADKIRPLIVRTKITLKIAQITEWEGKKVRHKPPLSLYVLHLVPDVNFNSNSVVPFLITCIQSYIQNVGFIFIIYMYSSALILINFEGKLHSHNEIMN